MDQVLESISKGDEIIDNLNELGTLLREETNRADHLVLEFIPTVLLLYKEDQQVNNEVIRVLVNFTADNDANRCELLKYDEFWKGLDYSNDRVKILLNQFILNSEKTKDFMDFFHNLDIYKYLKNFEELWEFLSELIIPERLDDTLKYHATGIIDEIIKGFVDLDDEDQEFASLVLCNITQFNDLSSHQIQKIYPLFAFTEQSRPNRYLFSTIGNLSSMDNFDDFHEVKYAIEHYQDTTNLYLKSSFFMVVGNYITSKEKQAQVLNYSLVEDYFKSNFNDVVQYQSIHMIKNLLTEDNAHVVINEGNLLNYCKVLKDNKSYYPEIYQVFITFLKKLATFTNDSTLEIWNIIDDEDIWTKLAVNATGDVNEKVIISSFKVPLESHKLLDNLKSMAILLNNKVVNNNNIDKYRSQIIEELGKLIELLINSERNNQFKVLSNNSKFVAVSLMKLEDEDINVVCKKIIATQ